MPLLRLLGIFSSSPAILQSFLLISPHWYFDKDQLTSCSAECLPARIHQMSHDQTQAMSLWQEFWIGKWEVSIPILSGKHYLGHCKLTENILEDRHDKSMVSIGLSYLRSLCLRTLRCWENKNQMTLKDFIYKLEDDKHSICIKELL